MAAAIVACCMDVVEFVYLIMTAIFNSNIMHNEITKDQESPFEKLACWAFSIFCLIRVKRKGGASTFLICSRRSIGLVILYTFYVALIRRQTHSFHSFKFIFFKTPVFARCTNDSTAFGLIFIMAAISTCDFRSILLKINAVFCLSGN